MSKFVTVRLRTDTRKKLDRVKKRFSIGRRGLCLADAADLAIDAFNLLPRDQQDALIEGRPVVSSKQ